MSITLRKLIPLIGLTLLTSWLSGQSDINKVYTLKYEYEGLNSAVGSVAGASSKDSLDVCYMIWFLKGYSANQCRRHLIQ